VVGGLPRGSKLYAARKNSARLGLAAALMLLGGTGAVHDATASNDTRTLSFHHTHSNEDLTVTFKRNGRYDEAALKTLNHFLRDWRTQDQTDMDRHLFDILWEVYRDVDGKQPINIISSYRSPRTNAMLRRRSAHSGVARFSQHMLGHAMDFYIPGVPLEQIRFAGLRLQRGGVGFYPTSGSPFVHLDTGNVRHWPRMTHDQLARVFPDGKTVHLPTDGVPLRGYQLALAEIRNRKGDDVTSTKPGLLAALLKGGKQSDDDDENGAAPDTAGASRTADNASADAAKPGLIAAATTKLKEKVAEIVPMPRAKPVRTESYQVASAVSVPAPAPEPAANRPQSVADIINARAFWDDAAATPKQASPEQIAAIRARNAASEEPQSTASLPSKVANAMAYVPPGPFDRSKIVAASAPLPPNHFAELARGPVGTNVKTIVSKALHGQPSSFTTMAKVAAARQVSVIWTRAMILAPDTNTSLQASYLGDQDMTVMTEHFAKPVRAVTMTFSDDPQMGLVCDHFSGSAIAGLSTTNFVQTASLR